MDKLTNYFDKIKSERKASPIGYAWQKFFEYLVDSQKDKTDQPPVPLILAASYLSPRKKHERFRLQLEWAFKHGILDESLSYLGQLNNEEWEISSEDKWFQDNRYWEDLER